MSDDPHVIDSGWDALPEYADRSGDTDDAVTVSISTTPGEWLVNTSDSVVVPMSMAEVVHGLREGKLTERSLVWRQGMQEWSPITSVPQLKLAARLPQQAAPARASEKSVAPPAPSARQSPLPHMLSRRSTLPFGLQTPPGSRPAHGRPTRPPTLAPSAEEPGVLAVYDRPAATISFDLGPEQPLPEPVSASPPAPRPAPVSAPQTLAPTTLDRAPRVVSPYRSSDLSVVAAADYRAVQRSSKRLVLACSLASAAAASVLTFWLARTGSAPAPIAAARPPEAPALLPAAAPAPPRANSAPQPVASTPSAEAAPAPAPIVSAPTSLEPAGATTPPRKARRPPRKPKPVVATSEPSDGEGKPTPATEPSSEPNPYDVKLEETPAVPSSAAGPSLEEAIRNEVSASTDSTKPGF